ncbi:SufB/SufD family protein [Solimonas flava]|uniref:SufB/SufD family protein n=1 Tax=Solimonas flava TaxID=415849 RepID=UPI00041390EC|nr:SufD family Fe-S cluster assembly protein [Solimonas flava]
MTIHASYGEAFERFAAALPATERAARAAAFDTFAQRGLPDDGIERWHYTNLQPFAAQPVHLALATAAPDLSAWRLDGCDEHVWINGRALNDAAAPAPLPSLDAHAGLAGLHRAFATPGLQLTVPRDVRLDRPLHVLSVSDAREAGEMFHLAHRIRLERGAQALLIVQNIGLPGATRFSTQSLSIELAEGAQLTLVRVQDEARGTTHWLQTAADVGRDARLDVVNVDLPCETADPIPGEAAAAKASGTLIRSDWRVKLAAPGAHAELSGLFGADGRVHLDNQYEIDHAAPHGTSRQWFRGLGFGPSQAILNGRVVVQRGAQKTDSEQRIANLMLAKGAEIDAKPELEIYADDVKCAHGASCGQLDDAAVFYLRARGVPEAQARALLIYSFINDVLARVPHVALRLRLARRITARLGAGLDLSEATLSGAAA